MYKLNMIKICFGCIWCLCYIFYSLLNLSYNVEKCFQKSLKASCAQSKELEYDLLSGFER